MVDYALFADEQPLTAPVKGTSGFAQTFEARGPFDRAADRCASSISNIVCSDIPAVT